MRSNVADYETLVGDLHDLRAFALASDLRSLTAVAKLMGESKATTSRRITRLSTDASLDAGTLVHVLPSYTAPSVNLYLLHRAGRFVPPKVRVFVDFVRAALERALGEKVRRPARRR